LSDRDSARHRSPQRALTPLSDVSEALTGSLTIVGRSSAALAVSTGLIATAGMPTQAGTRSAPLTSADTAVKSGLSSALLAASPGSPAAGRAALTAPMTATAAFEASAFTAVPAVARHTTPRSRATPPSTAKPARRTTTTAKATTTRRAAAVAAAAAAAKKQSSRAAAEVKEKTPPHSTPARPSTARHAATPAKATPAKAAPAKAAPAKAAPAKAAPAKKTTKPAKAKPAKPKPKSAPASSARGSAVLAIAARYVGTPYVYGGTTPHGFDCSGFTGYVYRQLGVHLPRTANQQMGATRRIARSQARPGDLVFFVSGGRAYHVGIYAGGGKMYDAPHTGARVSKRAIWSAAVVFGRPS
jgi:cell wall-associated NlpC family hydrolase